MVADVSLEKGLAKLAWRATAARIVIYLTMAAAAAQIFAAIFGLMNEATVTEASPIAIAVGTRTIVFLLSAIFVGMWIYRAHANLRLVAIEGLIFTPGWSVGWFFVPVASLFKPFQAMRELWTKTSSHEIGDAATSPLVLKLWWGAFLIGTLLDKLTSQIDFKPRDASEITALMVTYVISGIAIAISAWFLLKIIDRVTAAQHNQLRVGDIFG